MTVIKTIMLIIVVMGVLVALATVGLKFANAYVCRLDKRQGEATGGGPTPVGRWLSRHKLIDCLLFFVDENNNRIMDCCVTVTVILGMLTLFLMYWPPSCGGQQTNDNGQQSGDNGQQSGGQQGGGTTPDPGTGGGGETPVNPDPGTGGGGGGADPNDPNNSED